MGYDKISEKETVTIGKRKNHKYVSLNTIHESLLMRETPDGTVTYYIGIMKSQLYTLREIFEKTYCY